MSKIKFQPKTTKIDINGLGSKKGYMYYNHDTDTLQLGIIVDGEEVDFVVQTGVTEKGTLDMLKNIG